MQWAAKKAIARKVLEKGGNYVLQLKGNQSGLLEEVKAFHHALERDGYGEVKTDFFEQVDKGHGRLKVRRYQQFQLTEWVEKLRKWDGANSIIR